MYIISVHGLQGQEHPFLSYVKVPLYLLQNLYTGLSPSLTSQRKPSHCGGCTKLHSTPIALFFFFFISVVFKIIVFSTKFGVKLPACITNEILNLESEDLILGPNSSV